MSLCFSGLPYELNKTDWFFQIPNGSQIWLVGMDSKERVDKILGNEYSTIFFNECSQMQDYNAIATFRTRLAENAGLSLREYYDANPPSKSHWTYKVFIEGTQPNGEPLLGWETECANMQMNPRDNIDNLSDEYFKILEGLPLRHRQRFLDGLFGVDVEGALWNVVQLDAARGMLHNGQEQRTVIGVDPAVTSTDSSDEWGIIAGTKHINGKATIWEDMSGVFSPDVAINIVMNLYESRNADAVIVEKNQGGDMIDLILRQKGFKGRIISVTASKGKFCRAEPVQALYEQGLIRHGQGLEALENEMLEWVPHESSKSPNRIDALVWLVFELFNLGTVEPFLRSL